MRSRPKNAEPQAGTRRDRASTRGRTEIHIGILGYDGVTTLDLVGPTDVFATANEVWHLDQNLSVETLAARASLSPRHFSRRFSAVFGCAPARYVEDLRMSEARRMLGEDGVSIQRAAATLGFASTDVFRRAFERRFGLSPGDYRERFGP